VIVLWIERGEPDMAKGGHSEEEILRALREAESGDTVVGLCRKHGVSQQAFYLWKKKHAGFGLSELRELPHRHKIVVPANHEFFLESNPDVGHSSTMLTC
jgi:transposase-like protein